MAEIIILANSKKKGGHCIAGIDRRTGKWIRPVSQPKRAIPDSVAHEIELLDIVKIPLTSERPKDRYQRENHFVASMDWEKVGRVSPGDVLSYCDDDSVILHSHNDSVPPAILEKLPFEEWKSLQLIRVTVRFERDYWKSHRWRASFHDGSNNTLSLKIDYPEIVARLNKGDEIGSDCILTISMAGPWAPPDNSLPELCYKLVAGVIEL